MYMDDWTMSIRDSTVEREEAWYPVSLGLILEEFDEGPDYSIYRPRGAPHWILMNTLEGEGRFATPGSEITARLGDVVVIPPGACHDFGVQRGHDRWRFQFAQFRPRPEWRQLLEWPQTAGGLLHIHLDSDVLTRVQQRLGEAIELSSTMQMNRVLFGMNLLESALLWCDTQNPRTDQLDERVMQVIELIERNLAIDLSVTVLAKRANLSQSRFAALFRAQVGTSPQKFVEQRRLETAARLLDLTARPVASIAAEVGFPEALYFSTRFRLRMGMSPSAYRIRETVLG
jgi:AraC family transcriptional regulator of arabinose operon